ncbi:MAG: hypothetical protein JXR21_05240 [Candidatus Marinimicrobia bacterium]|nr:hypothetical protein [Candidatus Neomarinimicrobiota bacterium]
MSVNFDTLLTFLGDEMSLDEYRESYPDDPSGNADWFVIRDTFTTGFDLDMGMEVDPVSSSITQAMEFTEFSVRNFSLSDPIEMQEIFDLSAVPDGVDVPIDSIAFPTDTSYTSFPMDRQRFSSGTFSITITNDLLCALGNPITIALHDSTTGLPITNGGGAPVQLLWSAPIPAGTEATENMSMAGVEFPKHVMIIVSGVICGEEADTLTTSPAMRSSSFSLSGSIDNLVGEFVEGDLDAQLLEESNTISFGDELNDATISVSEVFLDTSHIVISISNTSNVTGKILLNVLSLDTSADPGLQFFTTDSMTIPMNSTSNFPFSLNSTSVVLTDDFEYETFINIPAQYGQLSADDEFSVSFQFYGKNPGDPIIVKSVNATFNQAEYVFDNVSMEIGMGDFLPEGFGGIELSTIDLAIDIFTDITIPLTVDMNLIGVKNSGADSMSLNISQQITGPGADNHLVFADAADLINFKPDSLIFNGKISLNGSGNIPLIQDISVEGSIGVPFQFEISEPVTFSPGYMGLRLDPLPAFLDDFSGSLEAIVDNSFQFGVDFLIRMARDTLYFKEPAYADCVRVLADLSIPAMDTTTQVLVLTKEDYDFLAQSVDSGWIAMDISLTGREDGQPTTFLTTDSVSIRLNIRAEGTLDFSGFGSDTTGTDTTGGA